MKPVELHCKWFGHRLRGLVLRTPRRWADPGEPSFTLQQTCATCGFLREFELTGNEAHAVSESYEMTGDKIWQG